MAWSQEESIGNKVSPWADEGKSCGLPEAREKHDWPSTIGLRLVSDWLILIVTGWRSCTIPFHVKKIIITGFIILYRSLRQLLKFATVVYPPSTTSKSIFHFYLNNSHQPLTVRAHSGRLKQFFSITCVVIVKLAQTMDCCHKPVNVNHSNWYWQQYMIVTLYTLTSVSIFSKLFVIHSPWYWLGEFV